MLPQGGLTESEAKERLIKVGPNDLPQKPPPSDLVILISQFRNPLIYVLFLAMVVTFFLKHLSDSIIILAAVILNTTLGFFQERKASNALAALRKLTEHQVKVVRDNEMKTISARKIVPGDLVMLSQGSRVPADGKLLDANRFSVDESLITGESYPVSKEDGEEVFSGTTCTAGRAFMKVVLTGNDTRMGSIAQKISEKEEDTPLKKQLKQFSNHLLVLVLTLTILVTILGLLTQKDLYEIFATSVALAVSSIPEGLLVAFTVVLSIGMQRISKRKGLVRKLVSAETLGSVTTICIDKTGTLTEGKMQAAEVVGEKKAIAEQIISASDLDNPLSVASFEWARAQLGYDKKKIDEQNTIYPRIDSLPFNSKDKFFASLNGAVAGENILFINGAPDYLIDWVKLDKKEKTQLLRQVNELTQKGRRVIGFAQMKVAKNVKRIQKDDFVGQLTWVGMVAFNDPVRHGVKAALAEAKLAGLNVKIITGDYLNTALFTLKEVGFEFTKSEIVEGHELTKMSDEELERKVSEVKLFSRVTPDDKFRIISALKAQKEVVAMMGDGVNDAPALNKADIGIVVHEASDVARESADLVLLDSNFATIVAAIEEGRGIFDNLRKIILYLLSDAFEEIVAVVGTIVLGLPLPVTAAQILWINLVSDGLPDLSLTVDPRREDIMKLPPRPYGQSLVTGWMKLLIGLVSLVSGLFALAFFIVVYSRSQDLVLARSAAFLTLGVNSLVFVFSVRTLTTPFWKTNIFANKWLIAAVIGGMGLQVIPFLTVGTRSFFGVTSLPLVYWMISFGLAFSMFIIVEVSKMIFECCQPKSNLKGEK